MYKVIIMRGIPGSGKTYQAKKILSAAQKKGKITAYCSADDYFIDKTDGKYKFEPNLIGHAHLMCMTIFLTAVQENVDLIIVDNTNTQVWEYTPYLAVAQAYAYEIEIIEVRCSQEVAFLRQSHGVPEKQHSAMVDRFQPVLPHHRSMLQVIDQ